MIIGAGGDHYCGSLLPGMCMKDRDGVLILGALVRTVLLRVRNGPLMYEGMESAKSRESDMQHPMSGPENNYQKRMFCVWLYRVCVMTRNLSRRVSQAPWNVVFINTVHGAIQDGELSHNGA